MWWATKEDRILDMSCGHVAIKFLRVRFSHAFVHTGIVPIRCPVKMDTLYAGARFRINNYTP